MGWIQAKTKPFENGKMLILDPGTSNNATMVKILDYVPDSSYTYTFFARSDNSGDKLGTQLFGGAGDTTITLAEGWKKYTVVATNSGSQPYAYFWGLQSNKGTVYLEEPRLYHN